MLLFILRALCNACERHPSVQSLRSTIIYRFNVKEAVRCTQVAKWICTVCEWIYDEDVEGIPFEEQPDDYICPVCGVPKDLFKKL